MLTKNNVQNIYMLSPMQEGMFFQFLYDKSSTAYLLQSSYRIQGDLKVELLEQSLNELFKRYDILRTVFIQKVDKKLFQVVLKDREIPFFYEDISKREDKEDYLLRFKEADIKKVFNLSKDVLMRASLFQLDTSQYEFIWTFHHILMDGWCMSVLIPELIEFYNSFVEGRTYRLSETRQYREYIQWLENQDREVARNYWQKYLEDYEGMASIVGAKNYDLPNAEYRINKYTFNISPKKTRILEKIAGNIQVTLNTLIQASWGILLGKYNNKQDVVFGVVTAGRPAEIKHIETMIGLFINTIPVRIHYNEKKTFASLLKQVQEQSVASERYHFFPLAEILALSQQKQNLFDHIMGYENFPSTEQIEGIADRNKELKLEVHRTGIFEQSPYDFNIGIGGDDQLSLFFLYNEAKFEDTFIKRVATHLCSLFDQIILCYNANLDFTMEELTWLSPTEKQKILFQFNATAADFPKDKRLHELFEMQVDQNPDSTALIFDDEYLTYRELNHQANRLKMVLSAKGLQPQGIAGLLMKRSTEMVMGILAILKAGAVYLPIDVETPGKRVEYMLNDTNARVLLTDSRVIKDYSFIDLIGLNVPGKNLHIHRTEVRKQIKNLEEILPIPDRSLISYEKYSSDIGFAMAKHAIAIQATRGCPYKCVYCHKIWPKTHVARSAEHIFEELQLLYNMGVRRFVFIDDIFNLKKENSERFFKLILKHKMKLQLFFSNGMRGDILTKDYIDLMVEAGTVDLALAMETASPRLQKLIGKNLDLDKLHENMDYICQKYPYVISELFSMHGFPTETESEAQSTMDFIKSFRWLHLPQAHILKIYPNTDMADIAIKNGISQEAIDRSENLAFHQLPETLPFDKSFTRRYQADYLDYILSKERLLHVLPYQMKILTEDELLQKYNSFLPTKINCLQDLCQLAGISPEEFGPLDFLPADHMMVSDFDPKLEQHFKPLTPPKEKDALRIMLMDVSQFFSGEFDMLYDVSEPPLGLMYLLTYLNKIYGSRVKGKVIKSRIDFDNFEQLKALMEKFRPEIIGIRSLTFFNQFFHKTTTMIREWGFNGLIIAGGPYATSDFKRILRDRNIDLVVLGEGEITFGELIGEIMANGNRLPGEDTLEKIPGIAYAKRETDPMRKNVFDREVIFYDQLDLAASKPSIPGRTSSDHLTHISRPSDISYVIYTSGTTGKPKGVPIQHRNVVRLMLNDRFQFDFNYADVWTMFHSYSFDFSVWEMYGALLYGGKLVVVPDMVARDPHRFLDLLKKYRVTVLQAV